jgi:hypothetical protein
MTKKVRLFPEYEAVDRIIFVFIDEFFNQRFGFGDTIAQLTRVLKSRCTVEILAKKHDFEVLRPILESTGIVENDIVWTSEAPPDAALEILFAHGKNGDVVGVTYEYNRDHEYYESIFRECEDYAIRFLEKREITRLAMPFDFVASRVAVSDSLVLMSDHHGPKTIRWLRDHVTQECISVPCLRTEPTNDLDVFILPLSDETWIVTQFDEPHEESETSKKVIAILEGLNRNVVRVPGLPRVVHDDVDCIPNYANSVLVNGVALVPQYGIPEDNIALRALDEAGYETYGIDATKIFESNYVFHCMTRAVPRSRNLDY